MARATRSPSTRWARTSRPSTHGAEAFECDVRLTADGHLVCVHDRDLRRTASTRGIVSTMDLADLDSLDFASWKNPWADLDDEAPDRDESLGKVLTLRKLLETVADYERPVELAIETKHPTRFGGLVERRLIDMLRDFGWDRADGAGPGDELRLHRPPAGAADGAGGAGGDADREGPSLADAQAGDRRGLDRRPRHQGAHRAPEVRPASWSRAATTSTSGPSTPPPSSSSAWTSASSAVITDRPAYVLEQLDG